MTKKFNQPDYLSFKKAYDEWKKLEINEKPKPLFFKKQINNSKKKPDKIINKKIKTIEEEIEIQIKLYLNSWVGTIYSRTNNLSPSFYKKMIMERLELMEKFKTTTTRSFKTNQLKSTKKELNLKQIKAVEQLILYPEKLERELNQILNKILKIDN